LGFGLLNSAIFSVFFQSGGVWAGFGGSSDFRGGGGVLNPSTPPPPVRH